MFYSWQSFIYIYLVFNIEFSLKEYKLYIDNYAKYKQNLGQFIRREGLNVNPIPINQYPNNVPGFVIVMFYLYIFIIRTTLGS